MISCKHDLKKLPEPKPRGSAVHGPQGAVRGPLEHGMAWSAVCLTLAGAVCGPTTSHHPPSTKRTKHQPPPTRGPRSMKFAHPRSAVQRTADLRGLHSKRLVWMCEAPLDKKTKHVCCYREHLQHVESRSSCLATSRCEMCFQRKEWSLTPPLTLR